MTLNVDISQRALMETLFAKKNCHKMRCVYRLLIKDFSSIQIVNEWTQNIVQNVDTALVTKHFST